MRVITLTFLLIITGCASSKHLPPQPNKENTWLINDAGSFRLIEKKVQEDGR